MRTIHRLTISILAMLALGCASFGVRPAQPTYQLADGSCARFEQLVNYAQELQEAYHSRAAQNRGWIYVGGALVLGTVAATGGLGAAGAGVLVLTLLSISGGSVAGFLGLIDNGDLAQIYTLSAVRVDDGLRAARGALAYDATGVLDPATCEPAARILDAELTGARDDLESARTDAATAAVLRMAAQHDQLDALAAKLRPPPAPPPDAAASEAAP